MIVYRTEDRIPINLGEITVYVAPLTAWQYADVMSAKKWQGGEETVDAVQMALRTLKFCLKKIEGPEIEFSDGTKFEIEFDESGNLTENSLAVMVQVLGPLKMSQVANKVLWSNFSKDLAAQVESEPTKSKKKK